MGEAKELKLHSLYCSEPITYLWPLRKSKEYDAADEIIKTIKIVSNSLPELKVVMDKILLSGVDKTSYTNMRDMCDRFNKAVDAHRRLWKGATKPQSKENVKLDEAILLRHIHQQVYNRSVSEPEKLNAYKCFTPEVYGETSYDLVNELIEKLKPTEDDVFIDLGSGVGQVVLQMAALSNCKECIGIEQAETPIKYARKMSAEFVKLMKWYGKKYRKFELLEGNFLGDNFRDHIMKAKIVFVNNFAFGPTLNHQLKQIFAELEHGTKIVSSLSFCPLDFRITERNLNDIGCVMNVEELARMPGTVSWTGSSVAYFLHTIDKTKIEKYFQFVKDNPPKEERRSRSINGSSKSSSSTTSSECSSRETSISRLQLDEARQEDENSQVPSVTTRRQWSEWLAKQDQMKKQRDFSARCQSRSSTSGTSTASQVVRPKPTLTVTNKSSTPSPAPHLPQQQQQQQEPAEDVVLKKRPGRPKTKSRAAQKASETKLKYQRQKQMKHASQLSTNDDLMETLNLMHQQTIQTTTEVSQHPSPGCSEVRISSIRAAEKDIHYREDMENRPTHSHEKHKHESLADDERLNLDKFLGKMRSMYEGFIEQMKRPEYKTYLLQQIELEKAKKISLLQRVEQLSRQIVYLQEEGVGILKQRLSELGMVADNPSELLNKAKEIVLHHKELQTKAASLETEVNFLEQHCKHLTALLAERDETTLKSGILLQMGLPDLKTVVEAKGSILREIGANFTRRQILLGEALKLSKEIESLEKANAIWESQQPKQLSFGSTVATPSASQDIIAAPLQTLHVQKQEAGVSSAVVNVVKSVAVAERQKTRTLKTPRRSKLGQKQQNPVAVEGQETPEEIEKKIQEIVRKALTIDATVKNEKERRLARSSERRRPDKGMRRNTSEGGGASESSIDSVVLAVASNNSHAAAAVASAYAKKEAKEPERVLCTSHGEVANTSAHESTLKLAQKKELLEVHGSESSDTESAPSDSEDFALINKTDQTANVNLSEDWRIPDPHILKLEEISPPAKSHKTSFVLSLGDSAKATSNRPSSVPVQASSYTIDALMGHQSYPRVSSACPIFNYQYTSLLSQPITSSSVPDSSNISTTALEVPLAYTSASDCGADSGVGDTASESEFSTSTATLEPSHGSDSFFGAVPGAASIPRKNPSKGSSNVGYAGSPHSHSNPGNPLEKSVISDEIGKANNATCKGSSNTGNPGNPHSWSNPGNPNPANPSAAASVDASKPKSLKRPYTSEKPEKPSSTTVAPMLLTQTVADLFGGEGRPNLQNFRIPRAAKGVGNGTDTESKGLSAVTSTSAKQSPLSTEFKARQEPNPSSQYNAKDIKRKPPDVASPAKKKPSDYGIKPLASYASKPALTRDQLEQYSAASISLSNERGLMETLLEQKMRKGKLHSHTQLAAEGEIADRYVSSGGGDDFNLRGPKTPPGRGPVTPPSPRGPRTPPSPAECHANTDIRHADSSMPRSPSALYIAHESGRHHGQDSPACSTSKSAKTGYSSKPSRSLKESGQRTQQKDSDSAKDLLTNLAQMTNVNAEQLQRMLSSDVLESLRNVDPAVVMITVTTVLGALAKQGQISGASQEPKRSESRTGSSRASKRLPAGACEEQLVTSTSSQDAHAFEDRNAVEMDIEQEDSTSDCRSSSERRYKRYQNYNVGDNPLYYEKVKEAFEADYGNCEETFSGNAYFADSSSSTNVAVAAEDGYGGQRQQQPHQLTEANQSEEFYSNQHQQYGDNTASTDVVHYSSTNSSQQNESLPNVTHQYMQPNQETVQSHQPPVAVEYGQPAYSQPTPFSSVISEPQFSCATASAVAASHIEGLGQPLQPPPLPPMLSPACFDLSRPPPASSFGQPGPLLPSSMALQPPPLPPPSVIEQSTAVSLDLPQLQRPMSPPRMGPLHPPMFAGDGALLSQAVAPQEMLQQQQRPPPLTLSAATTATVAANITSLLQNPAVSATLPRDVLANVEALVQNPELLATTIETLATGGMDPLVQFFQQQNAMNQSGLTPGLGLLPTPVPQQTLQSQQPGCTVPMGPFSDPNVQNNLAQLLGAKAAELRVKAAVSGITQPTQPGPAFNEFPAAASQSSGVGRSVTIDYGHGQTTAFVNPQNREQATPLAPSFRQQMRDTFDYERSRPAFEQVQHRLPRIVRPQQLQPGMDFGGLRIRSDLLIRPPRGEHPLRPRGDLLLLARERPQLLPGSHSMNPGFRPPRFRPSGRGRSGYRAFNR